MLNLALTLNGTRPACATERFPKPQIPLSSAMMRAHAISLIRTSGGEQFKEDSRLILVPVCVVPQATLAAFHASSSENVDLACCVHLSQD